MTQYDSTNNHVIIIMTKFSSRPPMVLLDKRALTSILIISSDCLLVSTIKG